MPDIGPSVRSIIERRQQLISDRALLVAISGIDSSGKGYCSELMKQSLEDAGFKTALIHADGWLNLPNIRFGTPDPARHYYEHAFRFDEMFRSLLMPLRDRRSVSLTFDFTEETATEYRKEHVEYNDIDIILVECIFLLKTDLRSQYDWSVWIDCSFETALRRAMKRGQEGLSPEATTQAFETLYFPAERIHLATDHPREAASFILPNDELA